MANLPLLMNLVNDFGSSLSPLFYEPSYYYSRYPSALLNDEHQHLRCRRDRSTGKIPSTIGKDGFQVSMDVQQFKPSELVVKVIENSVVVEGKHEEREDDHGYISRHFVRRYSLPKGYDPNKVVSTLSSDGVLTVSIPKPQIEDKSNERVIQIQQVGPAHLNVKENTNETKVTKESLDPQDTTKSD